MEHILCKVFAALSPCDAQCREAVADAGASALGQEEDWLFLEKDMLRISWEGMYFPIEEVIIALNAHLSATVGGKLDYLDLEAWTLTRYSYGVEGATVTTRSLNHILAYSGH